MKHLFQIKEQNRSGGQVQSRVRELEDELKIAKDALHKLQEEREHSSISDDIEAELKDTKAKLRIMTTKFANVRKERDTLKKENRALQNEILELQSNMRQMVPGLQNTSNSFPMINELGHHTEQFYKCDSQDLFLELLSPELSMEGVIYFFRTVFPRVNDMIRTYFAPAEQQLMTVSCLETLEGPIMNVLRKSYQATWKRLFTKCKESYSLSRSVDEIQRVLRLGNCSMATNQQILSYLLRLGELIFCYYISDPPLRCCYDMIGDQVEFNSLLHDSLDGFIRPGDQCYIILPPVQKVGGELLSKACVLHIDYELTS